MKGIVRILTIAMVLGILSAPARAQSNEFRDTKAHLGAAIGLFTYHGPIDLLGRRSRTNFVRESDPAAVFLGSFPVIGDKFYFRFMVLFTNFSTGDGRRLVGTGQNAFLTEDVMIFEPELVWTLLPGSKSRVMPYLFTGFGGTIADVFGGPRNSVDLPGTGVPGPERSVFHLPIGAGVDVAFTGCFSAFAEASWRFDLNYVFRNESNYDPHNTSLVMGGLRFCLRNPFHKPPPPPPIPPPLPVPSYLPPLPKTTRVCRLVELNTVYFAYNSSELDDEARRFLNENIDALKLSPTCCVTITGFTDRDDSDVYALRMSRVRAEVVYRYYLSQGLSSERFTLDATGVGEPCGKGKKGEGPGCPTSRRVESTPFDCSRLLR
jgi:OmpA family